MKREVKFKAWYEGKMYEVFSYNLIANIVEVPLLRFPFIQEVIPDNIIEYTGLKDEDGKEMYEGDIYDIYESKDATSTNAGVLLYENCDIVKHKGCFCFMIPAEGINPRVPVPIYMQEDRHLIYKGNIYEI